MVGKSINYGNHFALDPNFDMLETSTLEASVAKRVFSVHIRSSAKVCHQRTGAQLLEPRGEAGHDHPASRQH